MGSWKEIAAYLGVTDRTARRWESEEGLPVHRHWHDQRGTVWADKSEVDAWRASRTVSRVEEAPGSRKPESAIRSALSRNRKLAKFSWAAGVAVVLTAVSLFWWQSAQHTGTEQVFRKGSLLGAPTGIHGCPTISNDGRHIAYQTWNESLDRATIVILPRDGTPWRAVSEGDGLDQSPVFSPDSTRIAWWRRTSDGRMSIRVALVSGGPPSDVAIVNAFSEFFPRGHEISWTADGRAIIAPHRPEKGENGLFRIPLDGGDWQRLTKSPPAWRDNVPRLSADARRLAFLRTQDWHRQDICVMDLMPGAEVKCTPNPLLPKVYGLTWGPGDETLIASLAAYQGVHDWATLWQLPVSDLLNGTELPLQSDHVMEPHYVPRLKTLIYLQLNWNADLHEYTVNYGPIPKLVEARRIGPSDAFETQPMVSPDGRSVAFWSKRAGRQQLWVVDETRAEPRQLTRFAREDLFGAVWNPDSGSLGIAYSDSPAQGASDLRHLAVIPLKGQGQSLIGSYKLPFRPVGWVRSGEWIYGDAGREIVRVNVRNGNLEQCGNAAGWIRYWPLRDEFWYRARDGSYRVLQGCPISDADPLATRISKEIHVENLVPTRRGIWIQQLSQGKYFDLLFQPAGTTSPVRVEVDRLLPIGIEATAEGDRLFLVRMRELRGTPMLATLD